MPTKEHDAWLRLALTPGLSPRAAARAVEAAGGPVAALRLSAERLWTAAGVRGGAGAGPLPSQIDPTPVLRRAESVGERLVTPADPEWPREAFQALSDPPCALFVRGHLPAAQQPCVGVVGTRRATPYGSRVARELADSLARRGCCIVSGLALGIDTAAHAGALVSGAAAPSTLAVLGNGCAVAYPAENAELKERIAAVGGLLSEHPSDVPPERWHFPRRNRLVAALSRVLVVVEAPEHSGALLTAGLAVELGREVLAVPGPVDRFTHEGCHRLLRDNVAKLCRGARDVLEALGLHAPDTPGSLHASGSSRAPSLPPPPPGPPLALWSLLDPDEALDADELCRQSGLPAEAVTIALATLEFDGRAVRVPGVGYRRG